MNANAEQMQAPGDICVHSRPFAVKELVERLVDRILAAKARDASADAVLRSEATARQVSALEREIDQLVYALYGLTPDEIQIVESASVKTSADRGAAK